MEVLVVLVPLAITLGAIGLAGFLWSLRSGQYDDLDGAAWRAIADDEPAYSSNGEQDRQGDNKACPAQHKHPVEALSRRNQVRLQ
jgi:cbb3-type cytochrome oxidase maturation protein